MRNYAQSQIAELCANILAGRLRARGRDLEAEKKIGDEVEGDRPALDEAEQLLAQRSSAKTLEQAAELEVETPFVVPPGPSILAEHFPDLAPRVPPVRKAWMSEDA